jgi:hypothetical protein
MVDAPFVGDVHMTTTIERPSTEDAAPVSRVIRELARFEGHRQLKSPLLWIALAVSLGLAWLSVNDDPATLWARSVTVAGLCLPLAVAALLLANTAALRDRSSRTGETLDVPPTGREARMLGLIAGSWLATLFGVVVVVVGMTLSLVDDPAGSFLIPELLVGPLLIPLGQSLGVALGRWIPNPLAAPLALVVLAGLFLVKDFWPGERTIPAPSPFLPWRSAYTDWVQGEPRLPVVHIGYLIGLTALFTAIAARSWKTMAAAGLLIIGMAVPLASIDTAGEDVSAAVVEWAEEQPQTCEVHGTVEYCAIQGYEPWIDDWAQVVDRVQSLVPQTLGVEQIAQSPNGLDSHNDQDPAVAHVDGRLGGDRALVEQVLAPELGLPGTGGESAAMNSALPACMASILPVYVSGEARAVAYLVLTEQAAPGAIETGGFGGTYQFGQIEVSEEEAELAGQISARPEDEILSILHPAWQRLQDPETTSADFAAWFGFPAPQIGDGSLYESMQCECTGDGGVACTGGSP